MIRRLLRLLDDDPKLDAYAWAIVGFAMAYLAAHVVWWLLKGGVG